VRPPKSGYGSILLAMRRSTFPTAKPVPAFAVRAFHAALKASLQSISG
jgi:hypothetical protein